MPMLRRNSRTRPLERKANSNVVSESRRFAAVNHAARRPGGWRERDEPTFLVIGVCNENLRPAFLASPAKRGPLQGRQSRPLPSLFRAASLRGHVYHSGGRLSTRLQGFVQHQSRTARQIPCAQPYVTIVRPSGAERLSEASARLSPWRCSFMR